jgi:hypothetical protein
MKKEVHVYRLTDFRGNQQVTIVDDLSDNGCIGGYGNDGEYHQYDGYELYNAYEWAEKYGMKLQYGSMTIDVTDAIFRD